MGREAYASMQLASVLGQHNVKLVPDIEVGDGGGTGLATALVAKMPTAGAKNGA